MTKKLLITGLISLWTCLAFAQDSNKKYWLSGSARNVINLDEIHTDDDSLVTSKVEYGHTLVDLSANIKPNDDKIFIFKSIFFNKNSETNDSKRTK